MANNEADQRSPIDLQRSILLFILALALVRGIIYGIIVPPWQAPDEPAHFERVRAALSAKDWASTSDNPPIWYDELRDSLFVFSFFDYFSGQIDETPKQPLNYYIDLYQEVYGGLYGNRLSYAVIGWPLFIVPQQSVIFQLYLVRLNMVLMAVGVIYLAYRITQTIFPDDVFLKLGVPILLLFNPQHTHIMSTVNNGNLAELLATAALYYIALGVMQGFSIPILVAVLVFSLAAMWTKATAYFLLFALGSIGLFYLWAYRQHWRKLVPVGLLIASIGAMFVPVRVRVLLVDGWSHLQNGQLFLDPTVIPTMFRSFWAQPGWVNMRVNPVWYQVLFVACAMAVIGLVFLFAHRKQELSAKQTRMLLALAVSVIISLAIPVGWHILTGTLAYRQGRSIYPVIVPIYIFLLLGWRQVIPKTWRITGLFGLTAAASLFDTLVLFSYIIPLFYSKY